LKPCEIAQELISQETVSPIESGDAFQYLIQVLESHDVEPELREYGGVYNLYAGFGDESVCFNGHMDVVPPGNGWTSEPFDPVVADGRLYGRGASDMKGGLAAQIAAFLELKERGHSGASLMVVGDEEQGGRRGTSAMLQDLREEGRLPKVAVIGEPTDLDIQVGMRGIVWLDIHVFGDEYHASKPRLGDNATSDLPEVLKALNGLEMSHSEDDKLPKPTSEVTAVNTGDVYNSTPSRITVGMDIRYVRSQSPKTIVRDVESALSEVEADYRVEVRSNSGEPFLLENRGFQEAAVSAVESVTGDTPEAVTSGGASDGRFFAREDIPFVEIGLDTEEVHVANESCSVHRMRQLKESYVQLAERI
jgi:Acetylornithine deacetylase/Succinyl-diaminopimelate desuccinylase and related deacylases